MKANLLAVLLSFVFATPILALTFLDEGFMELTTGPGSVVGKIMEIGSPVEIVFIVLIVTLFKTSLSEEIFFRGFIAKRLVNLTNYQIGNILQSIIFGLLHIAIFLPLSNSPLHLSIIFLSTAVFAYLIVYLNDKKAEGSILPGWIAHATANLVSYSVILIFA